MCFTGGLGILARKNAKEMTCCSRKALVGWQIKIYRKYILLIKADLDGTIFAEDYGAQLACIMNSRQIMLCKLDPQQLHNTLWML